MLVIADLIGVPDAARDEFMDSMLRPPAGGVGSTAGDDMGNNPLAWLYGRFFAYVEDRRREPRDDVLTGLATATFPDGSLPEVMDVVRIATIVFAAGHESSTRFLTSALMILADQPEVQARLRAEPALIPNFIEECLRFESVVKGDFRLARVRTEVGGVEIPAGSNVMLLHGAANRDPRKFEDPSEFRPDRANARQHLAFGRGVHTCPGAPLVRTEARVAIEQLLARTSDIRLSEAAHGPAGARRFQYMPTFVLRGLTDLQLELDPGNGAS
jgi:cytochrome P450